MSGHLRRLARHCCQRLGLFDICPHVGTTRRIAPF
jgi:hypothetical protein